MLNCCSCLFTWFIFSNRHTIVVTGFILLLTIRNHQHYIALQSHIGLIIGSFNHVASSVIHIKMTTWHKQYVHKWNYTKVIIIIYFCTLIDWLFLAVRIKTPVLILIIAVNRDNPLRSPISSDTEMARCERLLKTQNIRFALWFLNGGAHRDDNCMQSNMFFQIKYRYVAENTTLHELVHKDNMVGSVI